MTARRAWKAAALAAAAMCLLHAGSCRTPEPPAPDSRLAKTADGFTLLFDGKTLAGWKVLTKEFFDAAGKVYVKNGTLLLEQGQSLTGVSWRGWFPRMSYEVRLEAMRLAGSDFFLGMTFPVGEGFCTLILGGWGGQVVGLSNVDGVAAHENDTTQIVEFTSNRWYRVELRVSPEKVRVRLDGEEIISQAVKGKRFEVWPQQEPVRPFGLASYDTKAAYRNVRVRKLDK